MDRGGTGLQRLLVGGVCVRDVKIKHDRHGPGVLGRVRDHHHGIADLELRMHDLAVGPFCRFVVEFGAEGFLHEADDFLRAVDDEIRGDGVEPVRYRFCSCRHHVLPGVERSGLTPELRPGLRAFAKLQKVPARRRKIVILRDS